jgi:hypothetical protein
MTPNPAFERSAKQCRCLVPVELRAPAPAQHAIDSDTWQARLRALARARHRERWSARRETIVFSVRNIGMSPVVGFVRLGCACFVLA